MPNTPINEDALDKMKVAVSEVISETTYTCSRVWEAWQYGTMTDEDFEPAWENDTLLTEVVEAVLASAQPVVNRFEPLKLNHKGWTCGCEPGNYDTCDECQSACNELANFLHRFVSGHLTVRGLHGPL